MAVVVGLRGTREGYGGDLFSLRKFTNYLTGDADV